MGRKKIEKAPKQNKTILQDDSASQPENLQADKVQKRQPEKEKGSGKKRGPKARKQKQIKSEGQSKNVQLFSQNFSKNISKFQEFYQEYLQAKSLNNATLDTASEFGKIRDAVRDKIQQACLAVMRKDLDDAINWIQQRQETMQQQISRVQKAEQETRKALQGTGTFSREQIERQTKQIRSKKGELEQQIEQLQQTKDRAKQIYKQKSTRMDEQ